MCILPMSSASLTKAAGDTDGQKGEREVLRNIRLAVK